MSDLTNLDGDLVNEVLKARRLAGIRHIRVVLSTDAGFIAIINPSFPAAADPSKADNAYYLEEVHPYVDWINVMAYDYHGAWES